LLVNDNVEQRRITLAAKLLAHERARAFYMSGFTPPEEDTTKVVERTPLYLPSGLSAAERKKPGRAPVVDAEAMVCRASMATTLEELLRHLLTRTFLQRYRVQNVTGVRGNTRARDGIASVSRRVDAAAAGYRRHRVAYKTLVGAGRKGWEVTYKPLAACDVRGLSEKALSQQELDERYRMKKLGEVLSQLSQSRKQAGGISSDEDQADNDNDNGLGDDDAEDMEAGLVPFDEVEPGPLAEAVGLGEGTRKVPWIWVIGLELEGGHESQLTDGELAPPYMLIY
jgi:hypothetical protein